MKVRVTRKTRFVLRCRDAIRGSYNYYDNIYDGCINSKFVNPVRDDNYLARHGIIASKVEFYWTCAKRDGWKRVNNPNDLIRLMTNKEIILDISY